MSEILRSLKSDLLDRRMLPILLLLGAALLGAIAYTVLAGGGSSRTSPLAAVAATPTPNGQGPALPVSQAPASPNAAVSETTDGARYRHRAGSHNPFTPLAFPKAPGAGASGTKPSSSSSSSSSKSEGKSGSSTGAGGSSTTPSQPVKPPARKKKPKPVYLASVQFGLLPSTPGELSQLTPYSLKSRRPLPSAENPLIVFTGTRGDGKEAVFALDREAIVKGQATCLPSAARCESIALAAGKSEQLEYLESNGQSVPYELKVVSIAKLEAAVARAARHRRHHHS